jgi:membrane fusion protein, multidrug efflux system
MTSTESKETRRETDGGPGGQPQREPARVQAKDAAPARGRRRAALVLGLLVLLGALVGGTYWYLTRNQESTDDAFVDGNVVQISPQVSGRIAALHITDNQRVQKGDLLIEIDPRDFVAARDQAAAALAVARAQAENARINLEMVKVTAPAHLAAAQAQLEGSLAKQSLADSEARRQTEAGPRATSQNAIDAAVANARSAAATVDFDRAQVEINKLVQQDIDQAKAQVDQLEARVQEAEAQLAQAELNLSYTKIYAPAAGWVTKRAVNVGDVVERNQTLTALVIGTPWVTANFKETELTRMRPGQPVEIAIDAYPDREFKGHVDSIQAGTGAHFSLLPPENATGNFVKVVQRVPVKITFDDPEGIDRFLSLGMSVVPTVDVAAEPEPKAAAGAVSGGSPEAMPAGGEAAR